MDAEHVAQQECSNTFFSLIGGVNKVFIIIAINNIYIFDFYSLRIKYTIRNILTRIIKC